MGGERRNRGRREKKGWREREEIVGGERRKRRRVEKKDRKEREDDWRRFIL